MAKSPTEVSHHRYPGTDGVELAYHEVGEGRPVILIHGLFSSAEVNWIKYGHAARLATAGFRVIMPDLRAHGDSAKPHDASAYPPDVLADDGLALVEALGLTDYDLGGYSLGGRTTVRMLVKGATPRRAIFAGMGLTGILDPEGRSSFFKRVLDNLGHHERGSPAFFAEAFLKTTKSDPVALRHVLDTFVPTTSDELQGIDLPVLVVSGEDDHDNGSAPALAAALPDARFVAVPGNHMSAVTMPELGTAMLEHLV
ncbi:alpha/beta fold hydrolase [Sphingomonas sp. ID0503]|uniref:alpha/beta fold hydrolase n=1 Tax=Sphingomonas sp. ID0503 TaxID=3399691 RepID=UPI003AFB50C3